MNTSTIMNGETTSTPSSSSSSSSSQLLAIACGPILTTWDISKSIPSSRTNSNHIDARACVGQEGFGVEQCMPHGYDCSIADLAVSHNGQVLATCSTSSNPFASNNNNETNNNNNEQQKHNIALTLCEGLTTLESFSNFHTKQMKSSSQQQQQQHNNNTQIYTDTSAATSISFGGITARSRYLCVSDTGGAISIWDVKKNTRSRCFRLSNNSSTTSVGGGGVGGGGVVKACMDPTDKLVVGLSGRRDISSGVRLDLFALREKKAALVLEDGCSGDGYYAYGGADCFQFSNLNMTQIVVGARDGSLLLWDIQSSSSTTTKTSKTSNAIMSAAAGAALPPIMSMKKRHGGPIMDVSFSPLNSALVASCSTDGLLAFHDVNSGKTIQLIKPMEHQGAGISSSSSLPSSGGGGGLSSLAFSPDGMNMVVGSTSGGIVHLYDLRQAGNGPLSSIDVGFDNNNMNGTTTHQQEHHSSFVSSDAVRRVRFVPKPSSSTSKTPRKNQVVFQQQSEEDSSTYKVSEMTTTSGTNQPSPGMATSSISAVNSSTLKKSSLSSTTTTTNKIHHQDILNSAMKPISKTKYLIPSPESTTVVRDLFVNDALNTTRTLENQQSQMATSDSYLNQSSKETVKIMTPTPMKQSRESIQDDKESNNHYHITNNNNSTTIQKNSISENDDDVMKSMDKMYERIKNREFLSDGGTNDEKDGDDVTTTPTPTKQQHVDHSDMIVTSKSDLQDMLDDAMEILHEDVEESIQNVHRDLIRQFQRQSEEMTAMFQQQRKDIEELLKENLALRDENEKLRRIF